MMRTPSSQTSWQHWMRLYEMAGMVRTEVIGQRAPVANLSVVKVRLKAVKVALAMVSGAYSTGLVSYFTHRDLFPCLMKVGSLRDIPRTSY